MTVPVGFAPNLPQVQTANEMNVDAAKIYRQAMRMRINETEYPPHHSNHCGGMASSTSQSSVSNCLAPDYPEQSCHQAHQFCALATQLLHPQRQQQAKADALYRAGMLAYQQGQVDRAIARLEESRILNLVTDRSGAEAKTLTLLGLAYVRNHQYRAALGCHMDAWRLYLEKGDHVGEIVNLAYLGRIYEQEKMPWSALDTYRRAIALFRRVVLSTVSNLSQGIESEIPIDGTLVGIAMKMAQSLHQAGELEEVPSCYRQVVWCNNQ